MSPDNRPTSIVPDSPAQKLIDRVDRRDKLVKAIEIATLFVLVTFNVFIGVRLQSVVNQNNATTVEARKQNVQRQIYLQNYIKCVLLIRYDNAPEKLATRTGVSDALDRCATDNPQ